MAIVANDIKFLLSAPQSASGYTLPGSPGNSLGLYAATTQLSTTPLDCLFLDLGGAANAADQIDYACVFIYNSNTTHTMIAPMAWLPVGRIGNTNTALFAVGADPVPPSILGSSGPQAVGIGNSVQAPSGVTPFAGPSATPAFGVALPNIPAASVAAVWIRRTATGGAGLNQFDLDVTFDTTA